MKKFTLIIIAFILTCSSFGQLTGIKTIPGDYTSIAAAVTDLNTQGVGSGGVVFNVAAGYTETASNLIITATGTSTNPVVFQKSGPGANPLITAAPGISTTLDGIIIFSGSDYVTINGIDITDPATNTTPTTEMEWGYALLKNSGTDGCQNISIMNCVITLQRIYSSSVGIYSNNHTTVSLTALSVTSAGGTNSNNAFYANLIRNVNTGIQITGFNDASPYTDYDQNNDVGGSSTLTGNTIQNYGGIALTTSYGIFVNYQNGCNISYNTLNNSAGGGVASASTLYGIYHGTSVNSSPTITNNTITLSQGAISSTVYNIGCSVSGSGTVTVNNNIIRNASVASGATGAFYCIYLSQNQAVFIASNNQFINCSALATTGSVYFISCAVAVPTVTIDGNTIKNITKTSPGGTFYGYYNNSAPSGGTETVTGNTFSNITLTGATTFYGFNSSTSASQNKNFYNNVVDSVLGGSSNMYCYYVLAGNTSSVYSNSVFSITNGNGVTGTGLLAGFYLGNFTTVALNAYSNTVYSLTNSNTGITYGMYALATSINISKNSLYGMSGNGAAAITYGIYISSGTAININNNFLCDLKSPISSSSSAITGIYLASGAAAGIYYNTVYLNASGTGTNFGSSGIYSSTTPVLDLRNNVIDNVSTHNGTGFTVAFRRSNSTLTTYYSTSNYNDFYAGTPGAGNLLFYDGTNSIQTLSAFKSFVWPRDAQSVTENPPFVNVIATPYDIHVNPAVATQLESGGTSFSTPVSIPDDFDAQPRYPNPGYPNNVSYPASAPDIGADEFAGQPLDLTPPNITFVPLTNTSITTGRPLTATITDPSGVPTTGAGLPVLYWKINSGSWAAATAVSGGSNQYTFTFGAGVVLGDVISYYVVAQDQASSPNIGSNPLPGATGFTTSPPAASTPPITPCTFTILGGVGGTVTVGSGGIYLSLTGAAGLFADINAKVVTGNITANIIGDLTEDGTNALNQWTEDGTGNYTLTIQPSSTTLRTIAGTAVTTGTSMININGADRVTINGVSKYLLFRNTNATPANTGATLQFTNGAVNCTASNCIFENNSTSTVRGAITIGSTGINNVTISGNDIRDATGGTTGTPAEALYSASASNTLIVTNNNFYNFSAKGIYFTNVADGCTISGNSFYNTLTTPPATAQTAIYITGSGNGHVVTGNYIGGSAALCGGTPWTNSGNVILTGIYLSVGTVTPASVQNNTIQNIVMTNTGSAVQFYGINVQGGVVNIGTVSGNTIGHPSTANSISINGTGTSYGIYSQTSIYTCNFENNIISNITLTGATGSPAFYGIYFYGANLRKNKITSIGVTASALTPVINGFYNYGTNNAVNEISNNIISLDGGNSTNPTIYGYYDYTYSSCVYTMYFNSISISGPATTTASTNVFYRTVGASYTLKDNIFSNTRAAGGTGKHYAIDLTGTGALSSDYNDLYSLAGPLGYWGSDQANLAAWQTASGGDANSVSVDPQFISSTDLHTLRTELDNTGTVISGITTDYSGIIRLTPPDMGAFEQPQVTTNPATGITQNGVTLNGTANACNQSAMTAFDLGVTIAYGSVIPGIPGTVTGMTNTPFSANFVALIPNTIHHFRARIGVGTRTYYGADMLIDPVPLPTITGPNTVCAGAVNNVYTTQYGKSNYQWSVSAGGTITGGGGTSDYKVTVTWNTAGAQTVSVNYQNSNGVSAPSPTVYNVTVNALPVPTITGPATVCTYATGVTYTTQPGMTGYLWSVSSGGIITGGSGTYTITVTWTTAGNQTVSVNYTNSNNCTAPSPTVKNVTVNAHPVPTITGPGSACAGTTAVYTTETGMTGYSWSVSSGGTITAGAGTYSVTVTWNTAGNQSISVNYTNAGGCSAFTPTLKNVTVNSLPVPTISGSSTVCAGTTGVVYYTQSGMSQYIWSVSSGGTITGGAGTYIITVTWVTAGAQTVSVNYKNPNGCTAVAPTVKNVTVNALPVPTITGPASVCAGTQSQVVYTTETGMTGYTWSVSSGGIINGGSGTYSVTVTWYSPGARTISVNYTNTSGCTAASPTVLNVTVNALPVPTITGPSAVCAYTSGVIYSTETGMTNYLWSVSSGGTITAGTGTYQVTVTWNSPGTQTVTVNYTNANGCTATGPTVKNVAVNSRPTPTITGNSSACEGTTGLVYITDTNMTGYIWSISSGGTITGGAGTYSVTVTWTTAGAQTISVNYTNYYGCTALYPTVKNVMVNSLPVPTITGPSNVCAGATGVIYYTEPGMNYYSWTITGGIITAGSGTSTVTVTWYYVGAQTITVNYYNANGCHAPYPTVKNVTVNALPVPTISGLSSVCLGNPGVTYTTESGMTGYTWTVSTGGTIISGAGTNTITVSWNTAGTKTVTVNYINSNGCTAATPTSMTVYVHTPPVPTITGPSKVCAGTSGVIYYTESQMTGYTWSVSSGGTITAGAGTYKVTVTWSTAGAQTISVNYTNYYGCAGINPTVKNVTVNALPTPTITGPSSVCVNTSGNVYTTEYGMTGYTWSVSSGGTITAGAGTYHVTVTWSTVGNKTISVNYYNSSQCKAYAPTVKNVTVNPRPTPTITGPSSVCVGTPGIIYYTQSGMTGYTWTVSSGGTIIGGAGTYTITVTWNTVGQKTVTVNYANSSGCTATYPAYKTVTVNPLPVPTLQGYSSVCAGTSNVTYYTDYGKTQYTWTISSGGVITSGAGTYLVKVTWTTPGAQWIKVNYANSYGCMAATPTQKNVTVNPQPTPTISGPSTLCAGAPGVYYTQSGMTNYTWSFSPGYTILGGGNSSSYTVTVKWTSSGSDWIKVNYSNTTGCRAATPTQFNVIVKPLPVPTVTGTTPVCQGATTATYGTQTGYTNYTWVTSTGGVITGGQGTKSIHVTWNGYGNQYVKVYCTSTSGCTGYSQNFYVTVNPATVPYLSGPSTACANSVASYLTQAGMLNYIWTISPGGIILSGSGTKQIYVKWITPGQQTIAVTFTTTTGCPVIMPTIKTVNVYPIPSPTISGPTTVCVYAYQTYTTEAGMTNYQWSLGGSGGIIYSGFGTSQILVRWIYTGAKTVSVNYVAAGGCYTTTPPVLNVTVNPCPSKPVTGIPAIERNIDFTVYPNPNDGEFNAAIDYPDETVFNIGIYNMTGILVYKTNDFISKGRTTRIIDLRSFPPGIYSVVLRNQESVLIRKIIINH